MMSAVFEAFTGRAGWFASFLVLLIVALTGITMVLGVARVEQHVSGLGQQYLDDTLSAEDSVLSFQVSGRDIYLGARVLNAENIQAGLQALPGVRRVYISQPKRVQAITGVVGEPEAVIATEPEMVAEAVSESVIAKSEQDALSLVGSAEPQTMTAEPLAVVAVKPAVIENTSEPDGVTASASPPEDSVPAAGAIASQDVDIAVDGQSEASDETLSPEQLIVVLNNRLADVQMFKSGESEISRDMHSMLEPLAQMLNDNPSLVLRIVGNVDLSLAPRLGGYIGFLRARNVGRVLVDSKVDAMRIYIPKLPDDTVLGEEAVQLMFYISK